MNRKNSLIKFFYTQKKNTFSKELIFVQKKFFRQDTLSITSNIIFTRLEISKWKVVGIGNVRADRQKSMVKLGTYTTLGNLVFVCGRRELC